MDFWRVHRASEISCNARFDGQNKRRRGGMGAADIFWFSFLPKSESGLSTISYCSEAIQKMSISMARDGTQS